MRRVCRGALALLLFALPALPAAAFSLLFLDPDPLDLFSGPRAPRVQGAAERATPLSVGRVG